MLRIILGVVAGFLAWAVLWFGSEQTVGAVWPGFRTHQTAFQAAIEEGSAFTPDSAVLLIHIVLAAVVSLIAGFLAALVAGETKRTPLILGILLLALGIMKAAMSWSLVPVWYHALFTAVLPLMAIIGGRSIPRYK